MSVFPGRTMLVAGGARGEIGDLAGDVAIGQSGLDDAVGLPIGPSSFARPSGIAVDRSVSPNRVYVSDNVYDRVLGWANADALASGAPADLVIGQADFGAWGCNGEAFDDGIAAAPTLSTLCEPAGLAVDGGGNLYVADTRNCRILVFFDPFGTDQVADLVLGQSGVCDGVVVNGSKLFMPEAVALDAAGNVFVADTLNCRVLEYDGPLASTDLVPDRVFGQPGFTTRSCSAANIYFPRGVAVDTAGTLHVAAQDTVHAYTDALTSDPGVDHRLGTGQCNDGGESASTTCGPLDVAADAAGRLYVADAGNSRVLLFSDPLHVPQAARVFGQPGFGGDVTLFQDACNTGGPSANSLCLRKVRLLDLGGTYTEAGAVAVDGAGRLWVADGLNNRVLRYDTPLADSTADLVLGHTAMDDVRQPTVTVGDPGIAVLNSEYVAVVVDGAGSRVLLYPSLGSPSETPVASIGQPDLVTTGCNTGGVSAASLCNPSAATVDTAGNLWIADTGNNRVLEFDAPWFEWDPVAKQYVVSATATRVFGQPDFSSAACALGASGLCGPRGVAVDTRANLYVADSGNHRVLHHENPLADGAAERVYGQVDFAHGDCNAGGVGADSLCDPRALVVDAAETLYVADRGNNRVVAYEDVYVSGGGADRVFGQGGSTTAAACGAGPDGLCGPTGLGLDRGGDLLVADTDNSRVLVFDAPLTDTVADRVLGQPDFTATACGAASAASLCHPTAVATAAFGDALFVADAGNRRVLRYDAPYCIDDYVLDAVTRKLRGVSRPYATKLKIVAGRGPASDDDVLSLADRLVLLEQDGGSISGGDEPLLTLTAAGSVVWQQRVPSLHNVAVTSNGGRWDTEYLEGEIDHGIDSFKTSERSVIPGSDTKPQYTKLVYKGRAVGLDLGSFTAPSATFRAAFGSTCFTTDLACTSNARGRKCKVAK